jgi:hypothetical protein
MYADTSLSERGCGDCHVCCQHLIVDSTDFTKPAGPLCRHCRPEAGCAIYVDRPQVCRDFHCSWRRLPLDDEWRPDRCGILLIAEPEDPARGIKEGLKFHFFDGLGPVFWPPFIEFAAALLSAGKAIYVSVPGRVGNYAKMLPLELTPMLKLALAEGNHAILVGMVATLVQTCRDAPYDPIVFANGTTG